MPPARNRADPSVDGSSFLFIAGDHIMARAIVLAIFAIVLTVPPVLADIFRWDNGQLIPGTEGITPGPSVYLSDWNSTNHNLRYADFSAGLDFRGAQFYQSWLENARFSRANLT